MMLVVRALMLSWCVAVPGAFALGIPQIMHMSKEDFLAQAFADEPQWSMLRLKRPLKQRINQILGHPYPGGRIRYWHQGPRTAWIIDEIGKEMPITMGLVVENKAIIEVKILVYREERGGEVHEPSFTRQFANVTLQGEGLPRQIDGISGATLSVDAVTRVAELALVLHEWVLDGPAPEQLAHQ